MTLLDTTDTEDVRAVVYPITRLIHVETLGKPTIGISDVDAIVAIDHAAGAIVSVDTAYAVLQPAMEKAGVLRSFPLLEKQLVKRYNPICLYT